MNVSVRVVCQNLLDLTGDLRQDTTWVCVNADCGKENALANPCCAACGEGNQYGEDAAPRNSKKMPVLRGEDGRRWLAVSYKVRTDRQSGLHARTRTGKHSHTLTRTHFFCRLEGLVTLKTLTSPLLLASRFFEYESRASLTGERAQEALIVPAALGAKKNFSVKVLMRRRCQPRHSSR